MTQCVNRLSTFNGDLDLVGAQSVSPALIDVELAHKRAEYSLTDVDVFVMLVVEM